MKHCMNAGNSIIGKNLFYVCSQFDSNITESFNSKLCFIKTEVRDELCMTVEFVRELLNIRDGVMKVSYMNVDEVQDIIDNNNNHLWNVSGCFD